MESSEIFVGLGLLLALGVGCQVIAHRMRLPAIVLLLPVGFAVGQLTDSVDPRQLFGVSFAPLVSLAVAVILFEGGLNLKIRDLEGHSQRVVRRLVVRGVLITWCAATLASLALFSMSTGAAVMLGAILIVSGPTVVGPILRIAQPGRRLTAILEWESATIDPIGAIIAALVFQALRHEVGLRPGRELMEFAGSVGFGVLVGIVGTVLLWLVVERLGLAGALATEATIALVIAMAAFANAVLDDTGLIAAITMGIALANLPGVRSPEDRPFFGTLVELMIGVLFIAISATVTMDEISDVLLPSLALIAILVLVVRPVVTVAATFGTDLTREERAFIALIDPRGIVAASTAATFAAPLAAAKVNGAEVLLPATFLAIVGTVTVAGLLAVPVKRALRLDAVGPDAGPDEPDRPPPSFAE